jgi:hypothetical protein
MALVWTRESKYRRVPYQNEADLEASILEVRADLFGPNRIYLDVKKKIGSKGGVQNVPDGYLLDLSGAKPRLYVVENELASHDPLRHVAVQILEFSLSFEGEPRGVKRVVFEALSKNQEAKAECDRYATAHAFRNLDHLLDYLVFETPFSALVIIDEMSDTLENALAKKFQFGVEVLELTRYENDSGDRVYGFEPFLADVVEDIQPRDVAAEPGKPKPGLEDVDTVVVPAWEDGFRDVFLGENRWYSIRIHASMRPQLKYIGVYQVAPVSAITHVAPIRSIEPWKDSGKYVVNFAEPAKPIGPILLVKGGRVKQLQGLRYTTRANLDGAKTLDDVW